MSMSRRVLQSGFWLLLLALMLVYLAFRLQVNFDLGAFLPRGGSAAAEALLEQLGSGPGSRLMVLGLSGGEPKQRQEMSRKLQYELSERPEFVQVLNGESGPGGDFVPEPVRSNYPLMVSLDYSVDGLSRALQQRLGDLALGGGASLRALIAEDPYLASL